MAKPNRKSKQDKDFKSDYDAILRLGTLAGRQDDVRLQAKAGDHRFVEVRTFTTYSAYEDPITE